MLEKTLLLNEKCFFAFVYKSVKKITDVFNDMKG